MPANDGVRLDGGQMASPIRKNPGQYGPKGAIRGLELWPLGVSLEDLKLMTEGGVLQNQGMPGFDRREEEKQEVFEHNDGYRHGVLNC